jgi:dolichol-phosphate mannosyltransferase
MIELSIVVPTYNERDNIPLLVERVRQALDGRAWEMIFVDDDSPDGTATAIRDLAQHDSRVRCLQRIGRRGLSTAVTEGMLASSAPYLAVIDADLQHDETLLPQMLDSLKTEDLDLVIASRRAAGGDFGDWPRERIAISEIATRLSHLVGPAGLQDPMSGFFMMRRQAFEGAVHHLSGQGFKILLDLFASAPRPFKFKEVPYVFRQRIHGDSKLETVVAWQYLSLLLDKLVGKFIPYRFILFGAVGSFGILVHLAALRLALLAVSFPTAQAIATVTAMTSNFVLNNMLTYRDRRLRGWRFVIGLLSFYAVCGVGAAANVGVASAIFYQDYAWWISGIAGALVGAVWNYVVSSVVTWRRT